MILKTSMMMMMISLHSSCLIGSFFSSFILSPISVVAFVDKFLNNKSGILLKKACRPRTSSYPVTTYREPYLFRHRSKYIYNLAQRRCITSSSGVPSSSPSLEDGLLDNVENSLKNIIGVQPHDIILVSVSGGSDSIALLYLLHAVSKRSKNGLNLQVVHFNHGLRSESLEEESFVEGICREDLKIPCHIYQWEKRGPKSGIQEAARSWRRKQGQILLKKLIEEGSGSEGYIATAHHSDDQVETVLLKILRGTHLSNIKGMEALNKPYIKPLLNLSKRDLVKFLNERKILWMEDPSNQDTKYKRNKVRHDLIPLLENICGGESALKSRIYGISKQSLLLNDWLQHSYQNSEVIKDDKYISFEEWKKAPKLLQHEIIHRFVSKNMESSFDFANIEKIAEGLEHCKHDSKWAFRVSKDWELKKMGDFLAMVPFKLKIANDQKIIYKDLHIQAPPELCIDIGTFEGIENQQNQMELYGVPKGSRMTIRYRLEGDRFHPQWKERPCKIKDFLRGQRIPGPQRDTIPIICINDEVAGIYPDYVSLNYCIKNAENMEGNMEARQNIRLRITSNNI